MVRILKVKVRTATPQDSKELVNLADELIRLNDWTGRELMLQETFQDSNCKVYVAEVDEKIVGFIELRVFSDFVEGTLIAIIQNLVVKRGSRNLGVGSNLIEQVIEEAEKRCVNEIHVWTEFDNQQAINFYTGQGFKKRAVLLEKETQ